MTKWRALVFVIVAFVSFGGRGAGAAWGQATQVKPGSGPLDVKGTVTVDAITFKGGNSSIITVVKDKGGDYPTPHWTQERVDKKLNQSPVCYLRGSTIKIDATFKLPQGVVAPAAKDVMITGEIEPFTVNGENITLSLPAKAATNVDKDKGEIKIEDHTCDKPLPNVALCLDKLKIKWKVKLGANAEINAGTTEHQVYVVRAALPAPGGGQAQSTTLFHTVLHVSCSAAHGKAKEQDTIDAIWNKVKTLSVSTWDGHGMTYYAAAAPVASNTQDLITKYDGTCGAWASFHRDILKVQGVAAESVEVKPWANPATFGAGGGGWVGKNLLVKNWGHDKDKNPVPGIGVPGQGVPNPATKQFTNHALVRIGTVLYDPSYGKGAYKDDAGGANPKSALEKWQDENLFGVLFDHPVAGAGRCENGPVGDTNPVAWNLYVEIGQAIP